MNRTDIPFPNSEGLGTDRVVAAGKEILREGEVAEHIYIVREGMGVRSKSLSSGRRQIVGFMLPGDFIGIQGTLTAAMDHSAEATTEMVLAPIPLTDVRAFFDEHPRQALEIAQSSADEEAALGEALTSLGQRDAASRMAWLLVSLYDRMRGQGLGSDASVPLPFRQQDLADALGLSLVHTNKTLAKLRRSGLAEVKGKTLLVLDLEGLRRLIDEDHRKAA